MLFARCPNAAKEHTEILIFWCRLSCYLSQVHEVHENCDILKTETSLDELQQEGSHMVSMPPNVCYLLAHEGN